MTEQRLSTKTKDGEFLIWLLCDTVGHEELIANEFERHTELASFCFSEKAIWAVGPMLDDGNQSVGMLEMLMTRMVYHCDHCEGEHD